jgi:hypothetical protein
MCYLSTLSFLPAYEIPGSFNELKPHLPEEACKVTGLFENRFKNNCVQGKETFRGGNCWI